MATEFGSIAQYKDLYPNKAGTRIVCTEDMETGAGLFFSEVAGGKTKQLCVLDEKDFDWQRFGMLGWSTDDSYFVYALPPDRKSRVDNLFICDGKTGQMAAKIEAPANLAGLAWLSPRSFAYLTLYYQFVKVVEQKDKGLWVETHDFGRVYSGEGSAQDLVAISPNSMAWHNGTNIWELDLNASVPHIIWQGHTNRIMDLAYSAERGELLLNCADEKGRYLIRFNPSREQSEEGGRIGDPLHPVQNMARLNGPSYAYLSNDRGTNTFCIKMDGQETLALLPWPGAIRTYTFSGDNLYVAGNLESDPAGIYHYDVKNQMLDRIVSSLKQPWVYARFVEPVDGVFANEAGTLASYHVWRPVNISPHKKYPLILSQTPYAWSSFPQIAANAGYYYALVDRPGWFDGIERWSDDVMALYNIMAKDANVDTERVFLYAASAETEYSCQLLAEKPDLCRGLIYFSPVAPPPLSNTRMSSMLMVVGEDEGEAVVQKWKKYQDDASEAGIQVTLDFVSGAKHISRSIAAEREHALQLAKYLTEN